MAILGAAGLFLCGGIYLLLARQAIDEDLVRNGIVGIRTRTLMASDAAWRAGHRAAAPILRRIGWATLVLAVLLLASGVLWPQEDPVPTLTWVLWILGYGGLLISTIPLVRTANRAGRAAALTQDQDQAQEQ